MPRTKRLRKSRKTKRMRGGNTDELASLTTAEHIAEHSEPVEPSPAVEPSEPSPAVEPSEPSPAVGQPSEPSPAVGQPSPAVEPSEPSEPSPAVEQPLLLNTSRSSFTEKAKNITRKAVNWLKGWFGIGGKRKRKTRKMRKH
jgi:hypothetical protein